MLEVFIQSNDLVFNLLYSLIEKTKANFSFSIIKIKLFLKYFDQI